MIVLNNQKARNYLKKKMQLSFLAPPTQYLDYFLTGIQRVNLRSEANSSTNYLNPLILASLTLEGHV